MVNSIQIELFPAGATSIKLFCTLFNVATLSASGLVSYGHFHPSLIFRVKARGYLVGALYGGGTVTLFTMAFNVAAL